MDLDAIFNQVHGAAPTVTAPAQTAPAVQPQTVSAPAALDLDSIFASVHGQQQQQAPAQPEKPQSLIDWALTRPSGERISASQAFLGPLLSMGDWVGADEGVSALGAAVDTMRGGDFSQAYDQRLGKAREVIDSFRNASPVASIGLDVAGAAKFIPTAVGKMPTLFTKAAQAAKEGALFGSLYGFGSGRGGAEQRATDAAKSGAIGAAAGLVATPLVEGGAQLTKKAADFLAEKGITLGGFIDDIRGNIASETGAIGDIPGGAKSTAIAPEELYLARQLKQQTPDELLAATQALESAKQTGTPLFLPEALDSADVYRNAKFIANAKPSMKEAQAAIAARKEGAGGRIEALLDVVAPKQDPASVGMSLINASNEAIDKLAQVRKDATAPLYNALQSKSVPDDIAITLLDDPVIDAAAKQISKNPAFAKEIGSAPAESFKSLQLIKENLDDQVASLVRAGNNNEARIVAGSREKLVGALEQLDEYKTVTQRYKELSKPINKLAGTKEETGLLEGILNTEKINTHKAPAELLKLTPVQIEAAKNSLGEKGATELRKSARSLLQDVLEKVNDGSQPALKFLQNEQISAKFRAMVGDEVFDKLSKTINTEKLIARANNRYAAGSDTAGNLAEAADSGEAMGLLSQLSKRDWKGLVERLMGQPVPDDIAQGMAQIYFNTEKGISALQNVKPLVEQYGKNARVIGEVATAAESAAARAGAPAIQDTVPTKKGLLAVGGAGIGTQLPSQQEFILPSEVMNMAPTPTIQQPPAQQQEEVQMTTPTAQDVDLDKQAAAQADDPLIKAVIWQESRGNPKAVSPKGATGKMQIMPATGREIARKLGYKEGEYDLKDPAISLEFGTFYLNEQLKKYGDEGLALAAYNAGPGQVDKWVKKYGNTWDKVSAGIKRDILDGKLSRRYFEETMKYVPSILKKRDKLVEA
jgi:hypothetical protein